MRFLALSLVSFAIVSVSGNFVRDPTAATDPLGNVYANLQGRTLRGREGSYPLQRREQFDARLLKIWARSAFAEAEAEADAHAFAEAAPASSPDHFASVMESGKGEKRMMTIDGPADCMKLAADAVAGKKINYRESSMHQFHIYGLPFEVHVFLKSVMYS